jgi:hypothetical protein
MQHVTRDRQASLSTIDCDREDLRQPSAARPDCLRASGAVFPPDAVAHIYRPVRSVMTSGRARTKGFLLRFQRRRRRFIEPLLGWTGDDDPLAQVTLSFPSREAAVAYAQRQGLAYVVHGQGCVESATGAALAHEGSSLQGLPRTSRLSDC